MKRIGVDVGGTFTDAVLFDEDSGVVASAKASSTHPGAEQSVLTALRKIESGVSDKHELRYLVHGTTVATNAVLEQSGPRVALICTKGFRDILEIARLMRTPEQVYDLKAPQPPCLVERRDRLEVSERTGPNGEELNPLDDADVRAAADAIRRRDITSVAVSLLYSYLDGCHEQRVRDLLTEEVPGLHVSLSSDVLPEYREYERSSTTALNAYLAPIVGRYLQDLRVRLDDWSEGARLWVMQSSGGVASPERAAMLPVTLLLSGPSGGVVAGRLVAEQVGLTHSVTIDMGGTSFDTCLLPDNNPAITHSRPFMEMPVVAPSVDVMAIGAGGGSLGWVDEGGQFRVGPHSAGAQPGPACYGRGGSEPTVTDANLVLGALGATQRLGGEVELDVDAAHRTCERLGLQLGMGTLEAAWGIRRIVNAAMAGTVRAVSVGRGYDPRDFGMVSFGGAGPMHALDIADELGIPTVVFPPVPGCHSAVGLVVTDISRDYVRTVWGTIEQAFEPKVGAVLSEMEGDANADLANEGVEPGARELMTSIDMRYVGQQFSVTVTVRHRRSPGWLKLMVEDFHEAHHRLYGFRVDDEPVEVVNVRLHATGRLGAVNASPRVERPGRRAEPKPETTRSVAFGTTNEDMVVTPVYHREEFLPGARIAGPAIIEQDDATAVIPPDKHVRCDEYGNLIVSGGGS